MFKFVHMEKQKATEKINNLLSIGKTKVELSDKLGITRVTLDTRLKLSNWRKGELTIIKAL